MTIIDKRTLEPGYFLYRQGEEATKAYLIQQGEINILKTIGNDKKLIATLRSGDILGERALLPEAKHSTSAEIAEGGATVVPIDKDLLAGKYNKTDKMIITVLESLIARLEHSNEQRLKAENKS